MTILQLFKLTFVFSIVLANNPNIYLIVLAALGWAVSLYFGFFRYRQYIWSRNKVRFDLLQKIDQRRSNLATKLQMICEISTTAKPRKTKLRFLLSRYFAVLQQIDFYQSEGVFDEAIIGHLRAAVIKDLGYIRKHDDEFKCLVDDWLKVEANHGNFLSTLTFEQYSK